MHLRAGACALALLLLALAGCTAGPRDAPGYVASEHGTPVEGTVHAAAAVVAGIAVPRGASAVTVHLGEGRQGAAPWPALVVAGARAGGATGTLFLRGGEVRLEGPMHWTLGSIALSAENLTGFLGMEEPSLRNGLGAPPQGSDLQRWGEHNDAAFWSSPLDLTASGAVTVNAASVVLATTDGLRDLGTGAVVEGGTWRSTAKPRTVEPPAAFTVTGAPGPRIQVALAEPRGSLQLAGAPSLALSEATLVDARAPDLAFDPADGGVRARLKAVAFQVYHGGEPVLRARVAVEPAEGTVALRGGEGNLGIRVREASGDADAVFRAVRTGGAANVSMPGFQSVWDSWPEELRLLMLSGPWAINFVFATVFMEGLRLFTGQYLPQPLQAGQEKDVTVGVSGGNPGGEAWVLLEGRNFDEVRLTLRLR